MGRLIDIDKARKEYSNLTDLTMSDTTLLLTLFDVLDNAPTIEAIPKADYEARLKADMVAMLSELQLQMEEYEPKWAENEDQVIASNRTWDDFDDIIQEKVNALKENKGNE